MGVFFAMSEDGYHFHPLNGGKPWFGIEHAGALIRDPFITRGPDGQFHMVWTWGWHRQSIGYAHSADLVHWSEQRELPLMTGTPGTNNTWAPETYWDEAKSQWLIVWSSTVAGRQQGNRIYSARTADFRTFSKPEVFFDPGYVVIDATMIRTRGRYYLVFKDERQEPLHREIKIADGRPSRARGATSARRSPSPGCSKAAPPATWTFGRRPGIGSCCAATPAPWRSVIST
jgi:sucrose-6-phosphate hydrolase SacC (GH32 family)